MNSSFRRLKNNVVASGVLHGHPDLVQQFQDTTERFLALTESSASTEGDSLDGLDDEGISNDDTFRLQSDRSKHIRNTSKAETNRSSTSSSDMSQTTPITTFAQEYSFSIPGQEEFPSSSRMDGMDLDETPIIYDDQSYEGQGTVNSDMVRWFEPTVERPLTSKGLWTYSFQETTFARRLHRTSLEKGLHLLLSPHVNPSVIDSVFRMTLLFVDKEGLLSRFRNLLQGTTNDSLENWDFPFFHVGGAGLHFPKLDVDGNPIYPPNIWPPTAAFGPRRPITSEQPRSEQDVGKLLDQLGMDGVWFDSHDVEQYLKRRGIALDGVGSFVEVDVALASLKDPTLDSHFSEVASSGRLIADGNILFDSGPSATVTPLKTTISRLHDSHQGPETLLPFGLISNRTQSQNASDVGAGYSKFDTALSPDHFAVQSDALINWSREPKSAPKTLSIDVSRLVECKVSFPFHSFASPLFLVPVIPSAPRPPPFARRHI